MSRTSSARAAGHGRPAWSARGMLVGLAVVSVAMALGMPASPAAAAPEGVATITVPGTNTPLHGGGSRTPYGVVLPAGASCPGDTAHDGYLVDSYLVPAGASPTEVSYRGGVQRRWFGYISDGAYFGAINTELVTGQIPPLPPSFTWVRLTPHDLFPDGQHQATWEGGIACANIHGVVTNYFNTQLVFTASSSDPGGFTWKVDQPPPSSGSSLVWGGLGLLVAVLVAGGAALTVIGRRRRRARDRTRGARTGRARPRQSPRAPVAAGSR